MSKITKSLYQVTTAAILSAALIGCVSTDDLSATQSMATKNQADIVQALAAANEAKALAEEAKSIASNAQSVAEQAMNMSQSTDERINRMFKRSMLK